MKQLTKAEEQIMQILWDKGPLFLREIVDQMPEPKSHQNTVATILKILVEKEFVKINVFGRQHQYTTAITKNAYSSKTMKQIIKGYFEGSASNVLSFLVKENELSITELETLLDQIRKQKSKK
ncbi:MAG TPA: BlaI/MecI/CopY family transcriptional regulator [Niabella sp.]|nr:BlaI/MecI/CopY family transcriptional regulator [Niabella sp.]HOZ95643.1 BlaI/MecI/CopY family transcriptional regulator [Niabella sp.]HQW13883.1 BlaI/MecI/CopY family transcriptional regulator [Niabella sp.]HQX19224.1 BlaI/MecI/CopY family transcriptional regulator [Niabella sp.]HQX42244.1 BlaI/MecI/CopY family transcriptional regulator [Niabella sp.]